MNSDYACFRAGNEPGYACLEAVPPIGELVGYYSCNSYWACWNAYVNIGSCQCNEDHSCGGSCDTSIEVDNCPSSSPSASPSISSSPSAPPTNSVSPSTSSSPSTSPTKAPSASPSVSPSLSPTTVRQMANIYMLSLDRFIQPNITLMHHRLLPARPLQVHRLSLLR